MPIKVKVRKKRLCEYKTQKEMDELFPGWEEMSRLSHGLMEDELTEKEKKRNCQKGNPRRDEEGRLSSKEDNTSWTVSNPTGKSNCSWGQSRMDKGSNKRKITKKDKLTSRCGRDKPKGTSKSRYRCKDGSAVWQEGEKPQKKIRVRIRSKAKTEGMILAMPPEWKEQERIQESKDELSDDTVSIAAKAENTDGFSSLQSKYMTFINSLTHEERVQVKALFCYDRFSVRQWNDIHKASDGKLDEPPKKSQ